MKKLPKGAQTINRNGNLFIVSKARLFRKNSLLSLDKYIIIIYLFFFFFFFFSCSPKAPTYLLGQICYFRNDLDQG